MGLRISLLAIIVATTLSACGGGGGGGGSSSTTPSPVVNNSPAPAPCSATTVSATNVQTVCVSGGVNDAFTNLVTTSVTVCVPSTSTCLTIPNVQVDTGSSGLRLLHSQIVSLGLPAVNDGANPYGECAAFADGTVWGTVASADVKLAGETASAVSIQVILDDGTGPADPAACTDQGTAENTQTALGVNGIIGVGLFVQDCGAACAQSNSPDQYFNCTPSPCTTDVIPTAHQVVNPVALFTQDSNGVVLQLPAVPDLGYASANAKMIFGINTQTNNQLNGAKVIAVPDISTQIVTAGTFTVNYKGQSLPNSFIDSGSSAYFFNDATIPTCTQSYANAYLCPGSSTALSLQQPVLTITGSNAASVATTIKVANAGFLFSQSNAASLFLFDDLGAPAGMSFANDFDLGVPFFFNKSVYTGFENSTAPAGPFFAWAPL